MRAALAESGASAIHEEFFMPLATFISSDGARHAVDVAHGANLMRAATDNGIEGIVGDCGGAMSCATCHVFVDDAFSGLLPDMEPNEDQILEYTAAGRQPNSRLACQIVMNDTLAGIVVRIADPQT
ncbi:MAG: 2Fe-2S iron-sulfur cluster-binding protein [Ramlibacter sp.]